MIFRAIGLIILLIALKIIFGDVMNAAEAFLLQFFRFGTAVLSNATPYSLPH